jgi:hypothetical protein
VAHKWYYKVPGLLLLISGTVQCILQIFKFQGIYGDDKSLVLFAPNVVRGYVYAC